MKKGKRLYIIAWVLVVLAFTTVAFLLPDEVVDPKSNRFWIIYIAVLISFCGQAGCSLFYASKERKQERFLMLPVALLGYISLLVTLMFSLFALANPLIQEWLLAIIVLGIFVLYTLLVLKTVAAANMVVERGEQVKTQTEFLYEMTSKAKTLEQAVPEELKGCLKKIYESFRYSDPVSGVECIEVEQKIREMFARFSEAVERKEKAEGEALAEQLCNLINERNMLIKGNKR